MQTPAKKLLTRVIATVALVGIGATIVWWAVAARPGPIQAVFYVAPGGADTNPGTQASPFATLEQARDAVRSINHAMTGDIIVMLRGGTYALDHPLVMQPSDSGNHGHQIRYQAFPGEQPLISGGIRLTDWRIFEPAANIWKTTINQNLSARQLYADGRRLERARLAQRLPGTVQKTTEGYTTTDISILSWPHSADTEFVWTGKAGTPRAPWSESRCHVSRVYQGQDGQTHIAMQQPCYQQAISKGESAGGQGVSYPTSMENNVALMKQPGQWYLESGTGNVYYIPRPGENLTNVKMIMPLVETLILGQGTRAQPLHDVQFEGLTFAYSGWNGPDQHAGFVEQQANHFLIGDSPQTMPAAITLHTVRHVTLTHNVFTHLGAVGLTVDQGSQHVSISDNLFTDISGSAIQLGGILKATPQPDEADNDFSVVQNIIHDVAVEYHGGVGIFAGFVTHTAINHNDLFNLPYSGISMGWISSVRSTSQANEIGYNHIHNVMQILGDGGAIYTFGSQGDIDQATWTRIHDNYIHQQRNDYGALYPDEGSTGIELAHNVIADVPLWLYIWTATIYNITVHDNFTNTDATINIIRTPEENTYTKGPPWPATAQQIIEQAGTHLQTAPWSAGAILAIPSSTPSTARPRPTDVPTPTQPTGPNLALQRPTTASSIEIPEKAPVFATDGDPYTRWSSAWRADPQWLQVDLGKIVDITKVTISWEIAYATAYQIQTSSDGTNWQTIYTQDNGQGGTENIAGLAGKGRYLRVLGAQRALSQYGYSIWELEVYSEF